jgi:hypothetical protein
MQNSTWYGIATHRQGLIILSDDMVAWQRWKADSREGLYVEVTPGALMHEAVAFSRDSGLPPLPRLALGF